MYLVEVQDIYNQAILCIFTRDGTVVHSEPTTVSFNALFGPDPRDTARWEERATSIVGQLQPSPKTGTHADEQSKNR